MVDLATPKIIVCKFFVDHNLRILCEGYKFWYCVVKNKA